MKIAALWIFAAIMACGALYALYSMHGKALRYVIAMVFAGASGLVAAIMVAGPVATYVTAQMRFESPDGAADVHMFTFLGVAAAG
ncbi:MAG: hypothetical protein AAGG99_04085, partial [Pseudomonadota bacterium]